MQIITYFFILLACDAAVKFDLTLDSQNFAVNEENLILAKRANSYLYLSNGKEYLHVTGR